MKPALFLLYVSVFRCPLQNKIVLFEKTSSLWAETRKLSLHQILQVGCFSGLMENFVDAESKFSSRLTKLFLARGTARADL